MSAYIAQSAQLACESSIAALAISNPHCNDFEFLLLRPNREPEREAELSARWPGRELQAVGNGGPLRRVAALHLQDPTTAGESVRACGGISFLPPYALS